VEAIVLNEDKYAALLSAALRELKAYQKKYASIKELVKVFAAINELEEVVYQ
jgi:hypothetical protein